MKPMTQRQRGLLHCQRNLDTIIMRDQRRAAIERDWMRMRDLERDWKRFEMRVGWAAAVIFLIGAIAGLVA